MSDDTLSDEALADLLSKAEAAGKTSPTPWAYAPDDAASGWVEDANGATPIGGYDGQWFKAPAEFAAAADPATVAALVREVQRLRAMVNPAPAGSSMARYSLLSSDPTRTDAEDAEMHALRACLSGVGVDLGLPPVPRVHDGREHGDESEMVQRLRLEERTQREAKELALRELADVLRGAASLRRDAAALSREIRASLVVAENNALRKNNERLTKENANLRERAKRAESANATAQTMAGYWKLQATGAVADGEGADAFSAPMCARCCKDSARCRCESLP